MENWTLMARDQPLVKKLESFELAVADTAHLLRPTLVTEADVMIQERLSRLSSLSPERLSNLAGTLLDYRLLDVAVSLQRDCSPDGQPDRLPIPLPPKMFFKQMANWPALITRGLRSLRECGDYSLFTTTASDPTLSIFSSLVHRRDTIEGHKIMGNFECAAAHISLVLKGITDLPTTIPEFQALVLEMCSQGNLPLDRWESFFSSMKTVHSFKLPLFTALSSSVVSLFLPSCLMTKDLNRLLLLQMWQGLGGPRPETLAKAEAILWRALFNSALGRDPLSTRFRAAFHEIEALDIAAVPYPESEWLAGEPTFQEATAQHFARKQPPSHGRQAFTKLPNNAPASLPKQPLPPNRETSSTVTAEEDELDTTNLSHHRPVTRSVTGTTKALAAKDQQPRLVYPAPTPKKKAKKANPERNHSSLAKNTKQVVSRDSSPVARTPSPTRSETPAIRKRAISASAKDHPQQTMKALRLEGGVRVSIFETIDLTIETRGPPTIDLTVEEDRHDFFEAESFKLWSDRDEVEYVARFHHHDESAWFSALYRAVNQSQSGGDGRPIFLAHPNTSWFWIIDEANFRQLVVDRAQLRTRQTIIIIPGAQNPADSFDEASLRAFALLNRPIWIQDFTHPPEQSRLVAGTVNQVLQSARDGGKVLAAPDFPMPTGMVFQPSLASDAHAWNMTVDQPWCHRRWEIPRGAVSSVMVSTMDAYQRFDFAPNGFTTHIEVKSGSQLLIVCQPSPSNPHTFASFALIDQLQLPFLSDWKMLSFQAIHLKAGYTAIIKPLVPYLLLSTEPSVVHRGYFFAASTLEASCAGLLISSVALNSESNQSQKAAHLLLRRLVHYYHLVFFQQDFIASSATFPHVPNIFKHFGVMSILALCNVFKLSDAILYTLSDFDRHANIEARRLCRRIVAWLDAHFIYTSPDGTQLDLFNDVWMLFLARQAKAMVSYQTVIQGRLDNPNTQEFRSRLDGCIKGNTALEKKIGGLLGWIADDFGWPDDMIFSVSTREILGTVPDSIQGETAADTDYLGTI